MKNTIEMDVKEIFKENFPNIEIRDIKKSSVNEKIYEILSSDNTLIVFCPKRKRIIAELYI